LYGVTAIGVEDPETHLQPELSIPDVLEPDEKVTIKISEKEGRKMTYTVAMVDEGLLDITKFKTPDAWSRFYAREALGVHGICMIRLWVLSVRVLNACWPWVGMRNLPLKKMIRAQTGLSQW
jgi:hypothetical protein